MKRQPFTPTPNKPSKAAGLQKYPDLTNHDKMILRKKVRGEKRALQK